MNPNSNNPSSSELKSKILTSFRIEKKLHQQMKRVANMEGMTMQGFMHKAIKLLIDKIANSVKE